MKTQPKLIDTNASAILHARCLPQDKAQWQTTARGQGKKLSKWIVATLNSAAKAELSQPRKPS